MKAALFLTAFALSCYLVRSRRRHRALCRRIGAYYAEAIKA